MRLSTIAFAALLLVTAPALVTTGAASFSRADPAPLNEIAAPGSPARCKGVASVLAPGERRSAGLRLLAMESGQQNGASPSEIAELRSTADAAAQRRDRTEAVLRRYAAQPAPNPETLAQLNTISIGVLRQELDACASAPVAAPTAPVAASRPTSAAAGVAPLPLTPQLCYVVATSQYDQARASLAAGRQYASAQAVDAARSQVERWAPTGRVNEAEALRILDNLSSRERTSTAQACAASGATPQPQRTTFRREDGFDRPGNDLRAIEVAPRAYHACEAACQVEGRCVAFTLYTPPPGDKSFCWLKHAAGERRQGQNVSSGLRVP